MAKSQTMKKSKEKDLAEIKKLKPAQKLALAIKLSDLCLKLKKAGKKAKRRGS